MSATGEAKPALTPEAVRLYTEATLDRSKPRPDVFGSLLTAYLGSPEYLRLAASTKRQWRLWADRAREEFGGAKLHAFSDPRMRGDIMAWRDRWAASPRSADYAMQVLSRVLSWGLERGWITTNPAAGVSTLYRADRSEVVWTDEEIEAVAAEMLPHAARAFRLAALTGIPRGDLVALQWADVGETFIGGRRGKTKVERVIPIFDETRALLSEFPRKGVTVVTNAHGKPYTPRGFANAVETAREAAGVATGKTLHDLRGTAATKLMRAGFDDREIDEIMSWEPGKSARIRRRYISRKAIVEAAVERMRKG
jgi:integrase